MMRCFEGGAWCICPGRPADIIYYKELISSGSGGDEWPRCIPPTHMFQRRRQSLLDAKVGACGSDVGILWVGGLIREMHHYRPAMRRSLAT
jgi:hypothetical protein